MPPPRRHSPGRRDRRSRSRSRSHSPRASYKKKRSPSPRSRERGRSPKDRRRSKSPYIKRERATPPRQRSRTPEKRKSLGSKRKSSSPHEYDQPIKRQADSTRRSYRSKSRSHSPGQSKKSRGSRRSSSPSYGGKMYSDEKAASSSSKKYPAMKSRKEEIDKVKIVDSGKKMDRLDKRFQTLEQLAQGSFDPEENITIGIHRGPHHMDLDEDVPVNYDFNPKHFFMLYPKKDYSEPIFDRDEIKAFHHDDILDEEAYVEKRTITVKPTDKPKASSSKYRDVDYKITIGTERDKYGDRRMVHDSSRSSRHDSEVKIRLDPKPDPKYERMYKEQQRQEDRDLIDDDIKRNPSDLRYNLIRKKSTDRDRDRDRDRDSGRDSGRDRGRDSSQMDARSRIEAKRKGMDKGSYTERSFRDQSPPTRFEKRKIGIRTELPDFKNRPARESLSPDRKHPFPERWGYCEICKVPINSEIQAVEHIRGSQHIQNEEKKAGRSEDYSPDRHRSPAALYIDGRRMREDDPEPDVSYRRQSSHDSEDKFQYEEWQANPELTPKGSSYYEHDNRSRDDMTFWERKQMFLQTGRSPSRGPMRGGRGSRMISRGISRGIPRTFNNRPPNRIRTPAMDEWKHDKFAEVDTSDQSTEKDRSEDIRSRLGHSNDKDRSGKDSRDRSGDVRYRIDRKGNKGDERKDRKRDHDHGSVKRENNDIQKEEEALAVDSNITLTAE